MKKSNLYLIYGLLLAIIANVAENRLTIGLATILAALYYIASLVMYYIEDKYN